MCRIEDIKAYADIRRLVSAEAFTPAMSFASWHNRLKMTATLDLWKALVVAFACEKAPVDQLQYSATKRFLDRVVAGVPTSVDDCRAISEELQKHLSRKES